MNIKMIVLHNFGPYSNANILFNQGRIYSFVAENGAGKTTLTTDAITYVLFGITRVSGAGDELIKTGETNMGAKLVFELNGLEYSIIRKRELNKSTKLLIRCGDKDITGNTLKETQKKISKIIGLDYKTFVNSVCFKQNESDSFSKLTPKEAKEQIMLILCLEIYDEIHDKIYKIIRKEENKKYSLENEIDNLNERLKDYENIESDDTEAKLQKMLKCKPVFEKELASLESQKCEQAYCQKGQIDASIKMLSKRKEKIGRLKDKCPLCSKRLSKEDVDGLVNMIDKNLEKLLGEKKKIDNFVKKAQLLAEKKKEVRTKLEKVNRHISALEERKLFIQSKVKKQSELNRKLRLNLKELKQLETRLNKLSLLESAFHRNGIPSYIISNVIPELEYTTNKIIKHLANKTIEFKIKKELKSGKVGNTLQILIDNRPYQTYSGGEKMIIDFAIRTALSIILTRRHGAKIETLILDEIFGSLDNIRRNKMIETINHVQREFGFKKIFLITHSEDIQDVFEHTIRIVKTESGSKILEN